MPQFSSSSDLLLRRKWTLRAHEQQVIFIKKAGERKEHVLMKALLWALYLPDYPDLTVEVGVGDRYKPDLVSLDDRGQPRFWGEAGRVSLAKMRSLARRYPRTHIAIAKWDSSLQALEELRSLLNTSKRSAPVDFLSFPADSAERFIDDRGHIDISHDTVQWIRTGSNA